MAKNEPILKQAVLQNGERDAAKELSIPATKPLNRAGSEQFAADFSEMRRAVQSAPEPRRNADTAFELLDRAARAFDVLISRFEHIEHELAEVTDHAEIQAREAASTIEQWRQISSALKEQLESSDRKNAVLKAQVDAAEVRAADAESRLKAVERSASLVAERAAAAEDLSTKLHDKVVVSFGIGSRMHAVFDAITNPTKTGAAQSGPEISKSAAAS